MSRFYFDSYDSDEEEWQYALWRGRVKKVLNGRPALRSFRELEQVLLALPAQRLIAGEICDGNDVCAVGAFALHKRTLAGDDRDAVLNDLEFGWSDHLAHRTAELGQRHGMTYTLAWIIGEINDETFKRSSPEDRYTGMLEWVRKNISRLESKHGEIGKVPA